MRSISFILTSLFCLASLQSAAEALSTKQDNPFASKSVCEMQAEDFLAKAGLSGNLTQPFNIDGPLNTGMCWWHSKLQRAAIYLAVFDRPNEPRPTSEEAKQIFRDLTQLTKVISIPGFRDWYHFTDVFRLEFYEVLGDWEISETLRLEFVKGLRALKPTDTFELQKISREVNEYKRVTFVLLKMPWLEAHSWLVTSYNGTAKNFEISFLDSKWPSGVQSFKSIDNSYVINEAYVTTRLSHGPDGQSVSVPVWEQTTESSKNPQAQGLVDRSSYPISLYVQNDNNDFLKITNAIRNHCGQETAFTLHEKQVRAKKEQRAFDQINWWRPGVSHN